MQAEVASFYHQNPEKFFSEIHKKEQRKFEEFSKGFAGSPQEVEAEMQSAITGGSEEALRVQRYLEKVGQPTRENYIAAAAMVKGIIHTPLDDNFDPRRLPDAQGLLSAAQTFQKLKASGVEFYDGTMSF
ncbi:MAG: hypothetical protein KDD70_13065 [Bdellovibrionales bacterium]|nr:hypothetical protein [Bdellovibrionales bacterium]